jgi:RNA polymerase sigma factor (sigma-70 family)
MTAAQESFYIQQFKLGDTSSFQVLYLFYQKRIFNYGKSLFPHFEDDLKDAYQDIFIAIWKARERLSVDKTLDFYLKRSIKNHMIHIKQKKMKFDAIPDDNDCLCSELCNESNTLNTMIESEILTMKDKIYIQKLNKLTKRQRFLFTERFIHEKSVEEIMKEQNLARQTVYNMIYKSINKLKSTNSVVLNWA